LNRDELVKDNEVSGICFVFYVMLNTVGAAISTKTQLGTGVRLQGILLCAVPMWTDVDKVGNVPGRVDEASGN
jgi:hypothetical protein